MRGMRSFGSVPTCSGWGFFSLRAFSFAQTHRAFSSAQDDDTRGRMVSHLVQGSGFKVEVAASPPFLLGYARKWYSSHGLPVITTIRVGPWRRGAPKAQDGSTRRCEKLCEAIRLPPVIPTEVEGSFLQTGKTWVRERRKRKHQGVV